MELQDFFDRLNILAYKKGTENNYFFKFARTLVNISANFILPLYLECSKNKKVSYKEKVGVVVSLTSFPVRINQIWYTIKTLKRQSVLPEKIILWLSIEQFPNGLLDIPDRLCNEIDDLFDIRFVENDLRSHKKYFYCFKNYTDKVIVTVDDDVFYNSKMLEHLIHAHRKYPNTVVCNRGLRLSKESVYSKWIKIRKGEGPSFNIIPTGVGGVLYPPNIYDKHIFDTDAIFKTCLRADDLWLNFMCRYKGSMIVTTDLKSEPITINASQKEALCKSNNGEDNGNDIQIDNISKWAYKELGVDFFYNVQ